MPSFKIEMFFIKCVRVVALVFALTLQVRVKAWDIDFSKRTGSDSTIETFAKDPTKGALSSEEAPLASTEKSRWDKLFEASAKDERVQQLSIVIEDSGFTPSSINLNRSTTYEVTAVNVSKKYRQLSVSVDAFGQQLTLPYGEVRRMTLRPRAEGIYTIISPETGFSSSLIVTGPSSAPMTPFIVPTRAADEKSGGAIGYYQISNSSRTKAVESDAEIGENKTLKPRRVPSSIPAKSTEKEKNGGPAELIEDPEEALPPASAQISPMPESQVIPSLQIETPPNVE